MTVHILQSHNPSAVAPWVARCLLSVREWARGRGFTYHFIGDELLTALPDDLRRRTREQPVVGSDIGRLIWLQRHLDDGACAAVWLDADTWIFDPDRLELPAGNAAVGREHWVQRGKKRLRCYRKVHNAAMLFRSGNSLLPFYRDTAERLLRAYEGERVVPQFVGPKLLTALHSISQFPVWEQAGAFSPAVITDLMGGTGGALALMTQGGHRPAAANLCCSSVQRGEIDAATLAQLLEDAPAVRARIAGSPA